jgi:hypothetical protein
MEIKEIEKIAGVPTYTNNRTEIIFKNGNKLVGYFEASEKTLKDQNKWAFVPIQQENNQQNKVILDGQDFQSITIYQLK